MPCKHPESAPAGRPCRRAAWKMVIAALCLLPVLPAQADLLRHPFSITYEVHRNDFYLGDSVRHFRQLANGDWQYQSRTTAKGLAGLFFHDTILETSTLRLQGKRVVPLAYDYQQSGGKDKESYRINFLWRQHKIYNSRLKKDFKLENNAQDVQTFLLQIMRNLQQHQNTMTFYIAARSDATSYVLTQNGTHKIETPYKTLNTIELVSNKRKNTDQYRVWCAVALDFMPVRVEKIDSDGNKINFVIKAFKPE
ncbi:MAG: DUF3108 domain-containing protein [Gammaproteobacteria bacterium]